MPASPRQIDYIASLTAQRVVPDETRAAIDAKLAYLAPAQVSVIINNLRSLPHRTVATVTMPGLYLVDDTVFEVKKSRESGRSYAKRLAGKSFVYDPTAIREIPADAQPMSVDEALSFGVRHGVCVKGHELTDELSIRLGVGPTCCKTLFGKTQRQLLAEKSQVVAA